MEVRRIDHYWSEFFGLETEVFLTSGIYVVPHARLKEYSGAWIYRHHQTIILSVPPNWVYPLQKKVSQIDLESIHSPQTVEFLFGDAVERTIGPAYQGYAEAEDFQPQFSSLVQQLSDKDHSLLKELSGSGDSSGWRDGGFDDRSDFLFGYYWDEKLVAVSRYIKFSSEAVFPGFYTHPSYRGRGYGKAVLSEAFRHAFDRGFFIVYQTLISNVSSMGLAESLGCREYAQHIAVRLKG